MLGHRGSLSQTPLHTGPSHLKNAGDRRRNFKNINVQELTRDKVLNRHIVGSTNVGMETELQTSVPVESYANPVLLVNQMRGAAGLTMGLRQAKSSHNMVSHT